MNSKYFSRKFLVTIMVMLGAVVSPFLYSKAGVTDTVTLAVLAILGGVGVAYGVVNVKDAGLNKKDPTANE